MQYLKDEVRDKIKEEALKEFKKVGYKGASIRRIAANSNTSVGNLYKYFESKEALYENIIGSVYDKLMGYLNKFEEVELNENACDIFYGLAEKIKEIFKASSVEIAVLFNKSQGSKYENCKNYFVEFVTKIVTDISIYELSKKGKTLKDNFIIYVLAHSLVESISIIVNEKEDGEEVRNLINSIIDIYFKDLENKLVNNPATLD
ncbi:TetR/AcrR family transcriptional regulator [Clostridium sp. SHJSY1]|uniref:TetR/AcrR family transcriptional regulator n=1 Tax=Clostridium sp. SHJSY1 TaxID=2942483 RepID=UPI002874ED1A|nr:TetR/AcrR family transcriptional regulator [Clostridium sp. SHJSY1]MDS0524852.1 TetR/AcrR family transcriptional regulator [Clostridium sp. SHJSY1]